MGNDMAGRLNAAGFFQLSDNMAVPTVFLSHACPTGMVGQVTHYFYWSYDVFWPLSHVF